MTVLPKNKFHKKLLTIVAAVVFGAVPLISFLFWHFGADLGFVLLPVVVIGIGSYKMHLDRLSEKTREITEASRVHLATVEALATAIDARDQVGIGHVRRTQIYAVGIGKILGLADNDIEALRTGALLHDIGKLAIPDHILNKPDSLTPAELEKTKIHPSVGAAILEKVGFQSAVVPTVRHHHESWDGRGYPDGLAGEAIPLTARILAVADAFDTIRGARPYRPARPREKARQIIQAEAGTRFDPMIVNTLIRNLAFLEADVDAAGLAYEDSETGNRAYKPHSFVDQIQLANREVFSLYELAREFSSSMDLNETLEMFANRLKDLVPYDTCAIYLLEGSKRFASAVHVKGDNADMLLLRRLKVGQGATGFALKSGEIVQNADPDLDFSYSQVELTQQYSTMASVPLIADDVMIGAVTIYARELSEYCEEHIRLLETLSRIASDAIHKSLKHDEATTHALTDPMTGLPNARSLQLQFDKEVARSSRAGNSFQVLMLDLDGFKAVNDNFGHKVGDQMLKEVSKVIFEQLREYDFLARYGGDEFVALIPETDPGDVSELCDRIEKAVCSFALPVSVGATATVGVSLGSAGYPAQGETFDQMIVAADKIMYERKTTRKRLAMTRNVGAQHKPAEPEIILDPSQHRQFSSDTLIVELDETHVVRSAAIN